MLLPIENVQHAWPFCKFEMNIYGVMVSVDYILNLPIMTAYRADFLFSFSGVYV